MGVNRPFAVFICSLGFSRTVLYGEIVEKCESHDLTVVPLGTVYSSAGGKWWESVKGGDSHMHYSKIVG